MFRSTPAVSVVVPAYNGERTILRTLDSIISQKYRPLQIVVVNDGSQDSTASLIGDFAEKNNEKADFVFFQHERNLGLSRSLNDGIEKAQGNHVLVLHQDCELMDEHWVEKALRLMKDEKVAVVTGYYGISDVEDETFVKRAFGVLRKQFHARPKCSCEEATFSEGKCDLYKKELLKKVGGFPVDYRIAGEDLIVSYKLRRLGYSIVKCYDLPVIQRFSGAAESIQGNLGKEFTFGKAMGGVFSEFKLFLFKAVNNSNYSGSRSLHRSSQPIFVLSLLLAAVFTFFAWWVILLVIGLLAYRLLYYFFRVYPEIRGGYKKVKHAILESIAASVFGLLSDFFYTFGFAYGLLRHALGRRL